MDLKTSFKILGLSPKADGTQVKRAYKAHVRRWHPDQFPEGSTTKAKAEEQLKQINIAYTLVKTHLALHPPGPTLKGHGTTIAPKQAKSTTDFPSGEKIKTRTWIDHLFNTLNAFARGDAVAPSTISGKESKMRRTTTFGQVLDEMSGGCIPPRPKRRQGNPAPGTRRAATKYRRCQRSGETISAIPGIKSPSPVKPVGRIRGIGKRR